MMDQKTGNVIFWAEKARRVLMIGSDNILQWNASSKILWTLYYCLDPHKMSLTMDSALLKFYGVLYGNVDM